MRDRRIEARMFSRAGSHDQPHLTARQYARIVHGWIESAGMESSAFGTHSLRRTKAGGKTFLKSSIARRPGRGWPGRAESL
jgi:hypothetical protein